MLELQFFQDVLSSFLFIEKVVMPQQQEEFFKNLYHQKFLTNSIQNWAS